MIRLFVTCDLYETAPVDFTDNQVHYLLHVMRVQSGDKIAVFNGKDGEWLAELKNAGKHKTSAVCLSLTRPQSEEPASEVTLYFSPIKKEPMGFLVQKATELGVRKLCPVIMRRTVAALPKHDKLHAQAVEAAEQSERLSVPTICPAITLEELLSNWPKNLALTYLNEREETKKQPTISDSLLIGPEGGFAPEEFNMLTQKSFAHGLHLGRRILRAETAALVALTLWNQTNQWKK